MSDPVNYRDFDAEIAGAPDGDPVSFKLGGTVFRCINPMPLGQIMVLAKNSLNKANDLATQAQQANLLWSFVEPEQHDALDGAISGLKDLGVMTKIFEHIITSSTGRPTPGL